MSKSFWIVRQSNKEQFLIWKYANKTFDPMSNKLKLTHECFLITFHDPTLFVSALQKCNSKSNMSFKWAFRFDYWNQKQEWAFSSGMCPKKNTNTCNMCWKLILVGFAG